VSEPVWALSGDVGDQQRRRRRGGSVKVNLVTHILDIELL
jgi:hypothetical protein